MTNHTPVPSLTAISDALNEHPTMPIPAYVWHSGGGIMLVRVDVAPDGGTPTDDSPFLLLSDRTDYDGQAGIAVGFYPTWEHTGEWPDDGQMRFCNLSGVHDVVLAGAGLLSA